jgi:hypothetical protein
MNKLQKWIADKVLGLKASPPPAGTMPFGVGQYAEVGGTITWVKDRLQSYVEDGYETNDIVYAAVMLVMDKVRVAPWNLYKVVDEGSLKQYQSIVDNKFDAKDWVEARKLKKKALEPMTKFDTRLGKLNDLLKWPNEYCTWNDLVADGAGFKMITGNEMLWGNMLEAGANQGIPHELINAPAQYMAPYVTRGWPQRIVGWQLSNGDLRQFTKEEILHVKYWNPHYDATGGGLMGMSPLKPGRRTLTRNNSAKKAGAVQLDNNGTPGIVYVDDAIVPAAGREAQKDVMKRVWAKEHAGAENYGKLAFSGYKMGYVSVGSTLKEMDLTGLEAIDLRRIFNLWGIPSQLGNDPDNKSYNNQKEAEKALTSRGALPHLIAKRDHFNRQLKQYWGFKGVNVYCDFDMSVYPELQEDQKEKWGWVKQLPVSSGYKLELMGLDIPEDPMMDEIIMEGNWSLLRDIVAGMGTDLTDEDTELNKAGLSDYLRVAK